MRDRWQTDDTVIYQANPAAVSNPNIFEAVCDMRTMAILYENKRENFLCKHCNIKYKGLGVGAMWILQRYGVPPRGRPRFLARQTGLSRA